MRKGRYLAILLIPVFGGVGARLLRVVIAFHLRQIGVSVFDITILSSVFMLSRGIFSPILGRLADRGISRFMLMIFGFIGLGVDSLIYPMASYPFLILLRGLDGLFGAMAWTTLQAMVHFHSPTKLRSRIMTSYFMMGGLGGSIGYIVSSYLMGNLWYAVILVFLFYAINIFLSYPLRDYKEERKRKRKMVGEKVLYSLSFLYGMFFSLGGEVLWFYIAETMGMGYKMTVSLLFYLTLVGLGGTYLIGHFSDRRGYMAAIWLLGVLSLLSGFMISINNIIIVLVGAALFYLSGRGFLPISRSFVASKSKSVGTSLGFVNFYSNIGSVIAPLIGGFLIDWIENVRLGLFNASALIFPFLAVAIIFNTYILQIKRG